MFRKPEPLLTRAELRGLIVMFMRLEANVARIAFEVAGEDEDDAQEET